jgi:hypothetical protein
VSTIYLDRRAWGARTDIPRLGGPEDPRGNWGLVPRSRRTHIINHHTVVIDHDATPNLWETLDEVKAKMRQLQTIRPNLGMDVPYNFVWFLMTNLDLIICEGRGHDRWGAHTAGLDDNGDYNNGAGIGIAGEGNFETYARDIGPWIPVLSAFYGELRETMLNLGSLHPIGADTYGHQNFANTACPGWHIYTRLPEIKIPLPQEEDTEMQPYLAWDLDRKRVYYVGPWGASWLTDARDVETLKERHGEIQVALHESTINSIKSGQRAPA